MLDIQSPSLPKNVNGFRTTHTCELCGFEPKTKNKYREKQDHLVMKHFKEKIDKIFPHCRPYSCPSADCAFTGKDKQALLRHYTGKHGILDRYLKEALAEKGIPYIPGDHGGKRKNSTDHNQTPNGKTAKKLALVQHHQTILDAKDMLPKSPVPLQTNNSNHVQVTFRPNSEDLRKEVEAMMASFQPQPQQEAVVTCSNGNSLNGANGSIKVVPTLPNTPVPVTMVTSSAVIHNSQSDSLPSLLNGSKSLVSNQSEINGKKTVILSSKLPSIIQNHNQTQVPTSVVSLIKRSDLLDSTGKPTIIMTSNGTNLTHATNGQTRINGHTIQIPELITMPSEASNGGHAIPIEVITTVQSTNGDHHHSNGNNQVVENEEVMWGAGTLGPAVVVEAADTVPVTYIEASEIVYSASLDNIDYEYFYPVTSTSTNSSISANSAESVVRNSAAVRERQLDFNML